MRKLKLYAWSCDFNSHTGEGILSQTFCKVFSKEKNVLIKILAPNLNAEISNSKIKINIIFKNLKNFKFLHYIYPFIGIIYLWFQFLSRKKVMYLNYLPLWNFLIFIFLPPGTILGPITGGSQIEKHKNNLIRKYFFPYFYKISLFFLKIRHDRVIFSTDLLKKFLTKNLIRKFYFLFCLNLLNKKRDKQKKNKKDIDILFYFNNHPHKFNKKIINLINRLVSLDFRVGSIGEKFPNKKVINFGKVSRTKVWRLMNSSKLSLMNSENYLSLYLLDCISCNLKVLVNLKEFKKLNKFFFKKNFICYKNNSSNEEIIKLISSKLNSIKFKKENNIRYIVKKINRNNLNYFSNLLDK